MRTESHRSSSLTHFDFSVEVSLGRLVWPKAKQLETHYLLKICVIAANDNLNGLVVVFEMQNKWWEKRIKKSYKNNIVQIFQCYEYLNSPRLFTLTAFSVTSPKCRPLPSAQYFPIRFKGTYYTNERVLFIQNMDDNEYYSLEVGN